jgi:hypothetical protein
VLLNGMDTLAKIGSMYKSSIMLCFRQVNQNQSMMKSARAEQERLGMNMIRVYHKAHCAKCARIARAGHFFDWLDRVDLSLKRPKPNLMDLSHRYRIHI